MKEWIFQHLAEVGFGVITTVFGFGFKKVLAKVKEQDALKLGVQALLRDRIIDSYNLYMDKGFCPIYARENLDHLSEEYYNLGGNGVIHSLMEKLCELPTELQREE